MFWGFLGRTYTYLPPNYTWKKTVKNHTCAFEFPVSKYGKWVEKGFEKNIFGMKIYFQKTFEKSFSTGMKWIKRTAITYEDSGNDSLFLDTFDSPAPCSRARSKLGVTSEEGKENLFVRWFDISSRVRWSTSPYS